MKKNPCHEKKKPCHKEKKPKCHHKTETEHKCKCHEIDHKKEHECWCNEIISDHECHCQDEQYIQIIENCQCDEKVDKKSKCSCVKPCIKTLINNTATWTATAGSSPSPGPGLCITKPCPGGALCYSGGPVRLDHDQGRSTAYVVSSDPDNPTTFTIIASGFVVFPSAYPGMQFSINHVIQDTSLTINVPTNLSPIPPTSSYYICYAAAPPNIIGSSNTGSGLEVVLFDESVKLAGDPIQVVLIDTAISAETNNPGYNTYRLYIDGQQKTQGGFQDSGNNLGSVSLTWAEHASCKHQLCVKVTAQLVTTGSQVTSNVDNNIGNFRGSKGATLRIVTF